MNDDACPLTASARRAGIRLRRHREIDMAWVSERHGAIYAQEFGWSGDFENLVAKIAARFIADFNPQFEACWIAERVHEDGRLEPVGSVFVVQARDEASGAIEPQVAQLRLLIVEPSARGCGLGGSLVAQCEGFARAVGYRRMRLWTQSILLSARAIYASQGYRLVGTEAHHSFGNDLIGEIWEREL